MRLLILLIVIIANVMSPAVADERIGAFVVSDNSQSAILLDGDIGVSTPLEFRRALALRPNAKVVVLSSDGGLVASALLIADDIHARGLSTVVPTGARCYSACSFIFFAGNERLAEGELGVHQMWSETPDPSGVQSTVSDILEVLTRFDTPTEVFTRMFRTPSEDMYVFTQGELEALEINRVGKGLRGKSDYAELAGLIAPKSEEPTSPPPAATADSDALRLALYTGLDFYGQDIVSAREADVVACAASCLVNQQCLAFTFNANPSLTRGPNCFLKSGTDRLEGYADALSGVFLPPNMSTAPTFRIGVIDPTTDVSPRTDLVGGDLTTSPWPNADTPGECRMACVDNDQCVAFSFASGPKQCWLKGSVGERRSSSNVTSGVKRWVSFSAVEVLDLSE
ncbi:PAN domain-containing protein [Devosia sp. SD17-2]|uniref:PAN domain-containing protein n=2 Tax=unclassified Devosia TaxID=196773 RepID=UPI0023D7FB76|nr:PAN domain-containing protein [Devosia sp. SD17-2]WEJ33215.1 PAN domain-containing protein [Devosia sp. SD17-2]